MCSYSPEKRLDWYLFSSFSSWLYAGFSFWCDVWNISQVPCCGSAAGQVTMGTRGEGQGEQVLNQIFFSFFFPSVHFYKVLKWIRRKGAQPGGENQLLTDTCWDKRENFFFFSGGDVPKKHQQYSSFCQTRPLCKWKHYYFRGDHMSGWSVKVCK